MMSWNLEIRKISDLKGYNKNPRSLSEKERRHLNDSVEKYGLIDKIIINTDNTIIGGHQRIEILKAKGFAEVECWVPDEMLSEEDVEELVIRMNRNSGSWDYDILANEFEIGDLLLWGFEEDDLGLGKEEKPKKPEKAVISIEFEDKNTMVEYIFKCEQIAEDAQAKIKIKG